MFKKKVTKDLVEFYLNLHINQKHRPVPSMATLPPSPVCHNKIGPIKLQDPTENCSWKTTEEDLKVSKIKVPCIVKDCDWKSREVVPDTAEMLLKAHIKLKHIPVQYTPPAMATLPQDIEVVEKYLASQMGVQKQAQLRYMAALPEVIPKATEDSLAHHPVVTVATHTAK